MPNGIVTVGNGLGIRESTIWGNTAATDGGYIDYTDVINFNIDTGGAGNFTPDGFFPGIPGANGMTGDSSMEVLTFVKFSAAGVYQMGVNSDDGFRVTVANTLVTTDPPDHRTLRNLVNQAFTPRAVTRLSHRVTQITQELLDTVKATGHMDVVSDIAFPLPAKIIAEMLGVPAEDWDIFQRWARFGGGRENEGSRERAEEPARDMRQEMNHYFLRLLEARRQDPRDDLITSLSNAEIDGERLSQQELVNFCFLLLAAGQETTKNLSVA